MLNERCHPSSYKGLNLNENIREHFQMFSVAFLKISITFCKKKKKKNVYKCQPGTSICNHFQNSNGTVLFGVCLYHDGDK